eukprot:2095328-Pyramimonas_sp.AAC.1
MGCGGGSCGRAARQAAAKGQADRKTRPHSSPQGRSSQRAGASDTQSLTRARLRISKHWGM